MASKSKKRRRVFRASCILAALIIAGSSFAWFTSKDEVTNRLTASADYGVSIVESFVPPENWVPGQTIKKEVFAVNTGNIDAFVEEEVSGLMTYSYETLVDSYGVAGVKYEPLGLNADDEAKSKQAGGYLIWNNAGVPNGPIADDWTPPADGDYIFRRAIETATNTGGTNVSAEKYALEGYHYDVTGVDYDNDATTPLEHYFKIKIAGNDDDANKSELGDKTYVAMNADGTALAADPSIKYYTIKEETAKPVSLTYKGTGTDNYLEAVYKANAGTGSTTAYGTDAATAQTIVNNGNIVALYEGRKALKDLGEAQITAINAVQSAAAAVKTAAQNYADAYDAVNTSGSQAAAAAAGANVWNQTDPETYTPALSSLPTHKGTGDTLTAGDVFIVTSDEVDASTLTAGAKVEVKKALTNYTTAEQAFNNAKQDLTDAIDALHTTAIQNGTETEANVAALQTAFDNAANAYYTAANNLKDAYANIESQIHDSGLLTGAAASTSITSLTDLVDAAKTMDTTGGASGYRNVLDGYIDAYESAAHTNESNIADMETKYGLYKTACEGYTTAKDNAETAYGTAVTTFNTEKLKSKSTDGLTAKSFADVVATVVIETADTAATKSEDNVMVEKTGDGYDKAQSKAKADLAKTYTGVATDAATLTPMVTGTTPDYDTTNNEVADTNYQGKVTELTNALTSSTTVYNDAKTALAAYNDSNVNAAANAEHTIKVKINLADGVKNDATWSQIPKADDDTVAHFYLNKILEAGETSDMLIKSVELDGETTTPASFKDMTFDLNVALKSAQVTYDDNNNILATAADTTFNNAKVNGDDNRVVTITDGKIGWTQVTTP